VRKWRSARACLRTTRPPKGCAGCAATCSRTTSRKWPPCARYGASYPNLGHTERLIVAGDPVDDVQRRNLAFQAQMSSVEEGAPDLEIAVDILLRLNEAQGLAVPVLAHAAYDERIPGAREQAQRRAARLRNAIRAHFPQLSAAGKLHVHAAVRGNGALETLP
jgi:hypothetical protein